MIDVSWFISRGQHNDPLCSIFGSEVVDDLDLSGFVLDWKSCFCENKNDLAGCLRKQGDFHGCDHN